jgi:hypothetical protein
MAVALAVATLPVAAQTAKPLALGSARLGKAVMADGKSLAAGTYMLRVSDEKPAAVVGQTADESRWVEFLQGGTVKGRELATVLSKDAMKEMAQKAGRSGVPAAGTVKVEQLKGDDYIRIWANKVGMQYLIHLSIAK